MKFLISALIIIVVAMGGWKLWTYWGEVTTDEPTAAEIALANLSPSSLEGLPRQLEQSLQEAQRRGPEGLRQWLDTYRKSALVKDPRLAWIELDFVVMVSRENPIEAKRVFQEVKKRIPPESPIAPRIQSLEKTFE